jgi:hypothetical protein
MYFSEALMANQYIVKNRPTFPERSRIRGAFQRSAQAFQMGYQRDLATINIVLDQSETTCLYPALLLAT